MFCNQCGKQIADQVKFCSECGAEVPGAGSPTTNEPDSGEPQIAARPVFNKTLSFLACLPLGIFLAVWGAGFGGIAFGMVIAFLNLEVPYWVPPVISGCLVGLGIPMLNYTAKKRTYAQTEYLFFKDRLEYAEGFWTAEKKTIRYDRISETSMSRGVIQKKYGVGTIVLSTAGGKAGSGIKIHDIEDPEAAYEIVQKLISNS